MSPALLQTSGNRHHHPLQIPHLNGQSSLYPSSSFNRYSSMNNIDYNSNISNNNPSGFSNSNDVQFSFSSSSNVPSSSSGLSKPRLNKLRKPRASILFSGNSSRLVELNDKGVFGEQTSERVANSNYVHSRKVNDDAVVDDISKLKIDNADDVSSSFRLAQPVFMSGSTKSSNAGIYGVGGNVSARGNSGFAFPTSSYVIRPVGSNVDSELQHEFKKLNVGDIVPGIVNSAVSAARGSMDAGRQSNEKDGNSEARSSECLLPEQTKNLNLKDSLDNRQKKEGTDDKPSAKTDFVYGSGMMAATLGIETETVLSSKMENMKLRSGIGHSSVLFDKHPSAPGTSEKKDENSGNRAIPVPFSFPTMVPDKSGSHLSADQPIDGSQLRENVFPSSSMSASGIDLQSGADPSLQNTDEPEKNDFYFARVGYGTGTPVRENLKEKLFSGMNQKMEFNVKRQVRKVARTKKRQEKVKQNTTAHVCLAPPEQDFLSMQSESQEYPGSPSSYSPMEVSLYQEILVENQQSGETSVTSGSSVHLGNNFSPSDSCPMDSNDALDEDLVFATRRLGISKNDGHFEEAEDMGSQHISEGEGTEVHQDTSVSCIDTESFLSAAEEFDNTSNNMSSSAENEASSYPNSDKQEIDSMKQFFSAQSCESSSNTRFSFAASSSTQDQSSRSRPYKKKNRQKVIGNSHISANPKLPYPPLSPVLPNTYPETLLPFSPQTNKVGDLFSSKAKEGNKFEVSKEHEIKKKSDHAAAVAIATQEACEKWRLRGNQAYANGNLSKAEEYYTLGLNCVSPSEQCKTILRAAMLCYSNRAATRMSLGRLREALEDCVLAASIDPCFLRVQVRAANCLLALGEVEEASAYFRKCLQSGSDVCVDRKIFVEASEGLQKAEKVHECLNESASLLQRRKAVDASNALDVIANALTISSHSEKLLEMKAEALFMLHRYEEVIQLCESSLVPADRNCCQLIDDGQLGDLDNSVILKSFSFKFWRCNYILRSQLYLGKLEEALGFLEKQEILRNGRKILEPLIPVAFTIRELLRHKAAGNEAFQLRKHAEAIEHYTTALSCNVESRPFTAICFCNRAAAYKALGQITDAIADCSLAIALDGKYFKAISRRASLFEMIRDYNQAAKDLERLVMVITKQTQEKGGQCSVSDKPTGYENDLGQAQSRLADMEEKARVDIRLDMYLILGVESSALASDIKKAYRKAALKHHPDKAGQFLVKSDVGEDGLWKEITDEIRKDADRLFKMIGEAYAVLSDPSKRSQYDAEEEMRLGPKSSEGNTSRTYAGTQNYPFEKSGSRSQWSEFRRSDTQNYPFERSGSRRHWSEFRSSYAPPNSRVPESGRSFW